MLSIRKTGNFSARLKVILSAIVFMMITGLATGAFAQGPPPGPPSPAGPPPPPPPPGDVLNKINPFKKHKKDTLNKKDTVKAKHVTASQPAGPPPPPNPLDLFKKKKKDTTKKVTPPGTGH